MPADPERAAEGRKVLEGWKREHAQIADALGAAYCRRCDYKNGLVAWPCVPARLIAALEEALALAQYPHVRQTVLAKLTEDAR